MPGPVKIGFEGSEEQKLILGIDFPNCGGQEWVPWATLVAARIGAGQLPQAQIKPFALSRSTCAKTDRIDAEMIARFMPFRLEAGQGLPRENLRIIMMLTTRGAQNVDRRKRLSAQIAARRQQNTPAGAEGMEADLGAMLNTQVGDLARRIESVIAPEETSAAKTRLLRSNPGIGPVSTAMLIAEMPEPGRMTSGEATAMTGLAPVPPDSGAMRERRAIAQGRRSVRHVLFLAALATTCHNRVLKPVAQRLGLRGKPRKPVIVAIARRRATIANAILKTRVTWRQNPVAQTQLLGRRTHKHLSCQRLRNGCGIGCSAGVDERHGDHRIDPIFCNAQFPKRGRNVEFAAYGVQPLHHAFSLSTGQVQKLRQFGQTRSRRLEIDLGHMGQQDRVQKSVRKIINAPSE